MLFSPEASCYPLLDKLMEQAASPGGTSNLAYGQTETQGWEISLRFAARLDLRRLPIVVFFTNKP